MDTRAKVWDWNKYAWTERKRSGGELLANKVCGRKYPRQVKAYDVGLSRERSDAAKEITSEWMTQLTAMLREYTISWYWWHNRYQLGWIPCNAYIIWQPDETNNPPPWSGPHRFAWANSSRWIWNIAWANIDRRRKKVAKTIYKSIEGNGKRSNSLFPLKR